MDKILPCIIVEDEKIHSNKLKKLLAAADNRVPVMAVCSNIEEAVDNIQQHTPGLVFLDINLQGNARGGFELLKQFKRPAFDVVFTTAHIDANIQEIRRCGISYLPKPYAPDELADALRKVWEKQVGQVGIRQLETLLHNLTTEQLDEHLIWLKLADGSIPVKVKDLVYCQANNQYTIMHIVDESNRSKTAADRTKKIVTSKGIGVWAEALAPLKFCRCHESYLINLRHITKVVNKTNSITLKHTSTTIPMSRSGKERLENTK